MPVRPGRPPDIAKGEAHSPCASLEVLREVFMSSSHEVRLQGVVSPRVLVALRAGSGMQTDTIIYGDIQDQAALHGLLARISDLGLELVDVQRIHHDATPPSESSPPG